MSQQTVHTLKFGDLDDFSLFGVYTPSNALKFIDKKSVYSISDDQIYKKCIHHEYKPIEKKCIHHEGEIIEKKCIHHEEDDTTCEIEILNKEIELMKKEIELMKKKNVPHTKKSG